MLEKDLRKEIDEVAVSKIEGWLASKVANVMSRVRIEGCRGRRLGILYWLHLLIFPPDSTDEPCSIGFFGPISRDLFQKV